MRKSSSSSVVQNGTTRVPVKTLLDLALARQEFAMKEATFDDKLLIISHKSEVGSANIEIMSITAHGTGSDGERL